MKAGWFFPFLLLGSWLTGVKRISIPFPDHFEAHDPKQWLRTPITNQNRDFINRRYGYFETMDIPCNEAGKEEEWYFNLLFHLKKEAYCCILACLYIGSETQWIQHREVQNIEIFRWAFTYRNPSDYYLYCAPALYLKMNNISLIKGYTFSDVWMAVGVYADEDGVDETGKEYQGRFYYLSVPLPYYNLKNYNYQNVGVSGTQSLLDQTGGRYIPRVVKNFGGRLWTYDVESIATYEYLNAKAFERSDRGVLNDSLVPLDFEVRYYDDKKRPYSLKKNGINGAYFYILEGHQNFPFGKSLAYDEVTKQYGYRFPLQHEYYIPHFSNRFHFEESFYIRKDGLKVYRASHLPAGFNEADYDKANSFILPPLSSNAATRYHFRIDILGCGPHRQISYRIDYYFTRSKNFFGHHTNSTYYVEESLL
ncbi:MAG: hypothetical protein PUC66_05515 [Erysipelotrichaceae bacterium]|nr:hypothetical protein [Erysipelotrichaceae bacterium]